MTDTSFSADNKSSSPQDNGKLLEDITKEIILKQTEATLLIGQENYSGASVLFSELSELTERAKAIKAEIIKHDINENDVSTLRSIEPKRKSVQNMLETEVAKTPKFEKLLGDKLGEKSPYEMRMGKLDWRNDDTKTVPVVVLKKIEMPSTLTTFRYKKDIPRGEFLNYDTNTSIIFGKPSIDETVAKAIPNDKRDESSDNRFVEARMAALYHMKEIIGNAICFDSHISEYGENSKNKSPNTLFIHKLYAVVKYEENFHLINLSVEQSYFTNKENEFNGTINRIYSMKNIEITPVDANRIFSPTVNNTNSVGKDTSTDVIYLNIPQLYNFVKTYDKSFFEYIKTAGRPEREAEIKAQAEFENAKTLYEKYMDRLDTYDPEKGVQALSEVSDKCNEKAELMTDLKDKLDEITEQKEYQRRGGHER